MRQLLQLDFVAPRRRLSWLGAGLLGAGAVAALAVTFEYRNLTLHRAGLEVRLAHLVERNAPSRMDETPGDARLVAGASHAAEELSTPWTLLLSELEQAGQATQGEVALLGVEPDHGKHTVRVSAEARTLALAIAYVQRLQSSRSLVYPMLDRHEIRADDAQHPVRFEMTGTWRDSL